MLLRNVALFLCKYLAIFPNKRQKGYYFLNRFVIQPSL
ncbi:hypothetical protein OKW35_007942 [Paraburkholderia sp. MM5477-R1]